MISQKTKAFFYTLLIAVILCIPVLSLSALGLSSTGDNSDIEISTSPENPQPYQDTTINISSYSVDLNKATIEWYSGSKIVTSGYGKTSYSFTAPGPNIRAVFNVIVKPIDSMTPINKTIIITPSELDVLWEATDSYTPPFYKGKALLPREGTLKVVAIPNNSAMSNGFTYNWKRNDDAVLDASGYNKKSYSFKNSELNTSESVEVSVSSVGGQYDTTNSIDIPVSQPELIFYKKSPSEGILYNQALSNEETMTEDEMTLVASPYFLSTKGNEDNLNYSWKINGKSIDTPAKKLELTVRPAARGGYATIDLTLENLKTFFQKVSGELKLDL